MASGSPALSSFSSNIVDSREIPFVGRGDARFVQAPMPVPFRGIGEPAAVRGEARRALFAGPLGDALDVFSVHRGDIDLTARDQRDFPPFGDSTKSSMRRGAARSVAAEIDMKHVDVDAFGRRRPVGHPVEVAAPREREVVVVGDRQRTHGIAGEMRDLHGLAVSERHAPDIQRARGFAEIENVAGLRPDRVSAFVSVVWSGARAGRWRRHRSRPVAPRSRVCRWRNGCSMLGPV